ncbi:hypothetical protein BDZ89DRAFT_1076972 [Hymenopellis radicata]|nr:hypothetical protein BDZ89DRAFT_1076972 [Hymenopellis radicata]
MACVRALIALYACNSSLGIRLFKDSYLSCLVSTSVVRQKYEFFLLFLARDHHPSEASTGERMLIGSWRQLSQMGRSSSNQPSSFNQSQLVDRSPSLFLSKVTEPSLCLPRLRLPCIPVSLDHQVPRILLLHDCHRTNQLIFPIGRLHFSLTHNVVSVILRKASYIYPAGLHTSSHIYNFKRVPSPTFQDLTRRISPGPR